MAQAVKHTADLDRILALPRREPELAPFVVRELTSILSKPSAACGNVTPNDKGLCPVCDVPMVLKDLQALSLHDIGICGGGFLFLDVGEGKTLISLLAPVVLNAQRPLLLLKAHLIKKTERDRNDLARHWRIPNHIRFMSYQMLGLSQSASALDDYKPDLIIPDESQSLKNPDAAVTRRVDRYMTKNPTTRMVPMTGTAMRASLRDFAPCLRWALKENAPVPLSDHELNDWALALDDKIDNEFMRMEPGALLTLADPSDIASETPLTAARRGFRRRLRETPGVVCSAESGTKVEAALSIRPSFYDVAPITLQHFKTLREDKKTPDGFDIWEATEVWRHARELALGFNQVWAEPRIWRWLVPILKSAENSNEDIVRQISKSFAPMIERATSCETESQRERLVSDIATVYQKAITKDLALPKSIDAPSVASCPEALANTLGSTLITTIRPDVFAGFSASGAIKRSASWETLSSAYQELLRTCIALAKPPAPWRAARRAWAAYVREVLSRSRTFDSPLQIEAACDAGKLGGKHLLDAWRDVQSVYNVSTVPVWHDDSALRAAAQWMQSPGIVWVEHVPFGERLAAFTGAKYYGADGLASDGEFIDDADSRRSIIASVKANREGRNLQKKWHRNLVTTPAEGSDSWQQILGRTHRPGQPAPVVTVDVFIGCGEHIAAWRKALAGAANIRDTVGSQSKLLIADTSSWPSAWEMAAWRGDRWER